MGVRKSARGAPQCAFCPLPATTKLTKGPRTGKRVCAACAKGYNAYLRAQAKANPKSNGARTASRASKGSGSLAGGRKAPSVVFHYSGGGCMVGTGRVRSCDDEWTARDGRRITCTTTQELHFGQGARRLPRSIRGPRDLRGIPGVSNVRSHAAPKAKLGTGARFRALEGQLRARGADDPKALAAWIGRRKYGPKRMAQMSVAGRKRRSKG